MIANILAGATGGICWSVLGIIREFSKPDREEFSAKKFLKSVLIGASIGAYLGYTGQVIDVSTIESFISNSALYTPLVAVTDKIVNAIFSLIKR